MAIDYTQIWIERTRKERMRSLKEDDVKRVCTYIHEMILETCENCTRKRKLGKQNPHSYCLYPNCNRKFLEDQLIMGKEIPRKLPMDTQPFINLTTSLSNSARACKPTKAIKTAPKAAEAVVMVRAT